MRRWWGTVPLALRFPLLAVPAVGIAIGVLDGGGGVAGVVVGLGTAGLLFAVAGLVALAQVLVRRRARARRAALPAGTGRWRAAVEPDAPYDLLGLGGPLSWLYDVVWVDVAVGPDGLAVTPGRGARLVGRFAPVVLGWDEVAAVTVGEPVHELAGRPRLLALTRVSVLLVGGRAAELAALEGDDAGAVAAELLVDAPDGLADLAAPYLRGRLPAPEDPS